ncbi:MAG TPA: hypothetical protein VJ806_09330 [Luteimonas sp.]|nr:hypothetical protein [Luteimonas sp.]
MKRIALVFMVSLAMSQPVLARQPRNKPVFPKDIQGLWQLGDDRCRTKNTKDSDGTMVIYQTHVHANEEIIRPVEITLISNNPMTWRFLGISSVAPPEIQGQALLYVLNGNSLVITDGIATRKYSRCR